MGEGESGWFGACSFAAACCVWWLAGISLFGLVVFGASQRRTDVAEGTDHEQTRDDVSRGSYCRVVTKVGVAPSERQA
jgi:hypothetical protein